MRTPTIDVPCGPPAAKGAPPGDAPPETAFAAVLQARTAPAEGQTTETAPPNDGDVAETATNPSLDAPGVAVAPVAPAVAEALPARAEAPAAPMPTAAEAPAAPAPDAAPAQAPIPSPSATTPQAPPAPGATVTADASVAIEAGAEPAEPAAPAPSGTAPEAPAAPGATDEAAAPKERTAPGRPEWAQGHGPERAAEVHERNDARQAERVEPATPATPATPQRTDGPATPAQPATPATPAQPATPATPATPGHRTVATLEPPPASTLTARVEQVHALVRLAREHGAAHARVELHPADLGRIDVVLRQTSDGLVASVSAHDAASVPVLETAGADLRRALEDRGVAVARVDVSLSDHGTGERRAHHADASRRPGRRTDTTDSTDPTTLDPAPTTVALGLRAGALVDVRA